MAELLRTKLFIPRRRANNVPRPQLVERLNAGLEKKLTLISAPAGFGKTTLLGEWISQCSRPVTWLFLDEGDNDPTRFWAYFIAALQGLHPDLGASAFALNQSPQPTPIKSILTELINDLTAFSDAFASVLDDYHFIETQAIHEGLSFLVDHLPDNMHLVITTREDPDLPLARLRARDHLSEIRALDLRFTSDEAETFLRGMMGLELSRQEVAALEERTEGWAAGLQLAGLSLQRQGDKQAFIADFSGSHRHIMDYLTDEVLRLQPEGVRSFLLQTAILDRLSGPLCNALTGRSDGARMLAQLEAANLFVLPLDDERRWYRYHHLFADLLLSELACSQPDVIPVFHRRASRWYEENGDIHAAVEHALQDTDLSSAAHLIEQHVLPQLYKGEVAKVIGWYDRLPESVLGTAPMLCMGKAWALVLLQRGERREEVEQALAAAQGALERVNADEKLRDLVAGHTASIQAFLIRRPALASKNPESLIALSQKALRLLPEGEKAIRATAALNTAYGYLALTDLEAASLAYQQTLEDGLAGGNYYAAIYGPINLAIIASLQGHLKEAMQLCESNIDRFNRAQAGQHFPAIGALYILKGYILLENGCLAEAEGALTEGIDLVRWTGEFVAPKKGYTALARLRAIRGDRPAMLETLKALEASWPEGARYSQALRHRLSMRHWAGDPGVQQDAQTWLAESGIEFEDLEAIVSVDPINTTTYEIYLNAAYTLAYLASHKPGYYLLEGVHDYLKRQQDFAIERGFTSWSVEIAIARSLLYQAAGKKSQALDALESGLSKAEKTGLFHTFLDEGQALQALLVELKNRLTNESLKAYTGRLVNGISGGFAKPEINEGHPGLLSERELVVLRCLATELTYEEIGHKLFLSLNTVQFHVKNIYRKLLVNKRVQAIEKARGMNLI